MLRAARAQTPLCGFFVTVRDFDIVARAFSVRARVFIFFMEMSRFFDFTTLAGGSRFAALSTLSLRLARDCCMKLTFPGGNL